jgi:hypothetical protein
MVDASDPDYADWQAVLENIYDIPEASLEEKVRKCRAYFRDFSGPNGWQEPSDAKLIGWINQAAQNWAANVNPLIQPE